MTSGVTLDLTGGQFGRLSVLGISERRRTPNGTLRLFWRCECSCGSVTDVWSIALKNGITKSCGCLARELSSKVHSTHRQGGTPAYITWRGMLDRCRNPSHSSYQNYGGRGIGVCDDWLTFEGFIRDMGPRPDGRSIERLDNNKGYNKENCKWGTASEQARNTRRSVFVEWGGVTRNICDWAADIGITQQALSIRIKRWGLERAMTTPKC